MPLPDHPNTHDHGVGLGQQRLLLAQPGRQTMILGRKVSVPGPCWCPRRLHHLWAQGLVLRTGASRQPLPAAHLVARCRSGPFGESGGAAEGIPVGSHPGRDHLRHPSLDPGNGLRQPPFSLERAQASATSWSSAAIRVSCCMDVAPLQPQHEPLMVAQKPGQGPYQGFRRCPHLRVGQFGQTLRIGLALGKRLKHRPARHPQHVREDAAKLDVGSLQQNSAPGWLPWPAPGSGSGGSGSVPATTAGDDPG